MALRLVTRGLIKVCRTVLSKEPQRLHYVPFFSDVNLTLLVLFRISWEGMDVTWSLKEMKKLIKGRILFRTSITL